MADSQKGALGTIAPFIQPAFLALVVGYFVQQLDNANQKIDALTVQVQTLIDEKNTLIRQIERNTNFNVDMNDYIRTSTDIEWLKTVETGAEGFPVFTMAVLSLEYERRFNVSLRAYQGRTDFDIWQANNVADTFYSADRWVFMHRERRCEIEQRPIKAYAEISDANPLHNFRTCRRPVTYFGKLAIAGRAVDLGPVKD